MKCSRQVRSLSSVMKESVKCGGGREGGQRGVRRLARQVGRVYNQERLDS